MTYLAAGNWAKKVHHSSQANLEQPEECVQFGQDEESTDVVGDEYVFLETESRTLNLASLMKVQPDISYKAYFSRSGVFLAMLFTQPGQDIF